MASAAVAVAPAEEGHVVAGDRERGTADAPRLVMRSLSESDDDLPLVLGAVVVVIGAALSGAAGFVLSFAEHAPGLQQLPYWLGFLLLAGSVMVISRLAALSFDRHRTRALVSLVCLGIYAALITLNYALQVAYVPYLTRTADPALAYVTMHNASAPTWVLEMFGYGALGLSTLIIAPVFGTHHGGRRAWIRRLFVANGIVSVAAAVVTAADLTWVQTVPGLLGFVAWNVLLVGMMTLVILQYRPGSQRPAALARFVK